MTTAIRCHVCTRALSPEELADETATTWQEEKGWLHLTCRPYLRHGETPHWNTEPREEES